MFIVSGFKHHTEITSVYVLRFARSFVMYGYNISSKPRDNGRYLHKLSGLIHKLNAKIAGASRREKTSLDKVVKTTCFLDDMADFAVFNEVYGRYFTSKPARSCVAAKQLPKGVLCEVEVIAEL